ncbi:hypothetical protein [Nostocoides sp. HKS02]|uniref:hypothetical protein n=1 Tax=Nostocoides sp. HKS02 TaxID=1813880 RepID=UPI0012B4CA80|nr:hypothetical protein [Tetrasphaera sp. HKS02]QGN56737.1 hypothetical protein GKE56_01160 [Tetrasphaera sp. HKS02]
MASDLHVRVEAEPVPGLLRPAIEAALAGLPWPAGPEAQVAAAVAAAVRDSSWGGAPSGRGASSGEARRAGTNP